MDYLCYLRHVFVILSRLFIAVLWSPAGKGLTTCHFPMWYPWSGVVLDFVSYLAYFFVLGPCCCDVR